MDVNKVLRELIFRYNSYPAVKLAWECKLPMLPSDFPLMRPSHFIKELGMTTAERLDLLCKQHRKLEFWEPGMDFSVLPPIIVFQNFQVSTTYSLSVAIRNISTRLQKVLILMESNSNFSVDDKSTRISKFAPGMVFKTNINFTPQEDKDFFQKLVIVTKDTRFSIPILGIGSRGIINPPDLINFFRVPVKCLKTRLITVTNVGRSCARFLLKVNGPFSVSPERGMVEPKQSLTMEVSFYSETASKAVGAATIVYENGDKVSIQLEAEAGNECIYLDNPEVRVNETYVGLKGMTTVKIVNDSPIVAEFKWRKYPSLDAATHAKFMGEKTIKSTRFTNHYSIYRRLSSGRQLSTEPSVFSINYDNLPEEPEEVDPAFTPNDFLIEPVWGKVQPYSSADCLIVFSPYQSSYYEEYAFMDVAGREQRLPLHMEGKGVKPQFTFGFDEDFVPLPLVSGHQNDTQQVTQEVTFDITIGGEPAGAIKIALFGNVVPKTVKNFVAICSDGINRKTYSGTAFHRVIKNFMIQGGDIVRGDGTGSRSIYGGRFDDENFKIKHSGPGFVSMANSGPNTNGCQFFITAVATPWLDGHHVVFGKVMEGLSLVTEIENLPTGANDRPKSPAVISHCTVNQLSQPYDLDLNLE